MITEPPSATDPHAAFRACIADAPDDEGPKLVYADQLDEWGDLPTAFEWRAKVHRARIAAAPDDLQPRLEYAALCDAYGDGEQAEFIRVGVELAGVERTCPGPPLCHWKPCVYCSLSYRSRALLARHGTTWARAWLGDGIRLKIYAGDSIRFSHLPPDDSPLVEITGWHAGAPSDFRVDRMAAWRGETCGTCQGTGKWFDVRSSLHGMKCYQCANGRVGGLGAAIVRAVPCRSVECGDKEPFRIPDQMGQSGFAWLDLTLSPPDFDSLHGVPGDVVKLMTGYERGNGQGNIGVHPTWLMFPTAALARAALARVLIAEAWGQAQNIAPARS